MTAKEIADKFRDMALLIEANDSASFGGAFVMVPPGDREPVQLLILDTRQSPFQFYANIETMAKASMVTLAEEEIHRKAYGVR